MKRMGLYNFCLTLSLYSILLPCPVGMVNFCDDLPHHLLRVATSKINQLLATTLLEYKTSIKF